MGRCCDGRNAYKPISKIRYLLGIAIFYIFNVNLKLTMFLRHAFIKKYPHYKTLVKFHNIYFNTTLEEIKQRKGLVIKTKCAPK